MNADSRDLRPLLQRYIETGKALDAVECARVLGWTTAKFRRLVSESGGCPDNWTCAKETRDSHSKDYPMMLTGTHVAWVYRPSLELLRQEILRLSRDPQKETA